MNNNKQYQKNSELPEWFNGAHYASGDMVTNPFSGMTYYLNRTELSMYDFIMGCSLTFESHTIFAPADPKLVRDYDKARDWFRKNNAEAYMVLID